MCVGGGDTSKYLWYLCSTYYKFKENSRFEYFTLIYLLTPLPLPPLLGTDRGSFAASLLCKFTITYSRDSNIKSTFNLACTHNKIIIMSMLANIALILPSCTLLVLFQSRSLSLLRQAGGPVPVNSAWRQPAKVKT